MIWRSPTYSKATLTELMCPASCIFRTKQFTEMFPITKWEKGGHEVPIHAQFSFVERRERRGLLWATLLLWGYLGAPLKPGGALGDYVVLGMEPRSGT